MPTAVAHARHPRAPPFIEPPGYVRHRPESTLLYQFVDQHYPAFREMRAMAGRPLPDYIDEEFDAYLKCGRLEDGFLRVRCEHFECNTASRATRRSSRCGAGRWILTTRRYRHRASSAPEARTTVSHRQSPAGGSGSHGAHCIRGRCATRWPLLRIHAPAALVIPFTSKTPYRDGTTHIVLEHLELMARLAALVPPPWMHLTCCEFEGVRVFTAGG